MAETVFAGSGDGRWNSGQQSDWATARGDASSASPSSFLFNTTTSTYDFGLYSFRGGSRGSVTYGNVRSYFPFDLSSLSGTATSATFSVYADNTGPTNTNGSTVYLVQATVLAGTADDRGNVFSSGTTLGTLLGSGTISSTLGYHDITLNSGGITAINNAVGTGTLTVGLMTYYDYNNVAPSTTLTTIYSRHKIYYSESSSTSNDPKLTITFDTGYSNNVMGVSAGSIGKINGVATADIDKVNGM